MELTNKQKSFIKARAHHLSPSVRVGRGGVSAEVVAETNRTLEAHELIKVKIDTDDSSARKKFARDLAEQTESELVGTVGKIAILFRQWEENSRYDLPR